MNLIMLASAASFHTFRWVNALTSRGHKIVLISFEEAKYPFSCQVHIYPHRSGIFKKLLSASWARKKISAIAAQRNIDILHFHSAGIYGLWGLLCGTRNYILSVWGSDILVTPSKSRVHRFIVGLIVKRPLTLLSTSFCMKEVALNLYGREDTRVTPFGVDCKLFKFKPRAAKETIEICCIKTLEHQYGIDILVDALDHLSQNEPSLKWVCKIFGEGRSLEQLEKQVASKNLADRIFFGGKLAADSIPSEISRHDIFVYPSRSESFGVSALEAMATGRIVIASNAPGHKELISHGVNGFLFPIDDSYSLFKQLRSIASNIDSFAEIEINARSHVLKNYEWQSSIDKMEFAYEEHLLRNGKVNKGA